MIDSITAAGHCPGSRGGTQVMVPPSSFFGCCLHCPLHSSLLFHMLPSLLLLAPPVILGLHPGLVLCSIQVWSSAPLLHLGLVLCSIFSEIWLDLNQQPLALCASAHTAEPQISYYVCAGTYTSLLTCVFVLLKK